MSGVKELLVRIVAALDAAGIPFMIAGSFASTSHGIPRTTQDLDVVIDPADASALDALLDALPMDAYYVDRDTARDALRSRSMFNVIDNASGWKVDFIVRKNRPFSVEEMKRRVETTILGVPVFVASPEDTIVAKLEWSSLSGGSERQRRDVAGILSTMRTEIDLAYVERWVDAMDLRSEWVAARAASIT
jgi:hypothetical protein